MPRMNRRRNLPKRKSVREGRDGHRSRLTIWEYRLVLFIKQAQMTVVGCELHMGILHGGGGKLGSFLLARYAATILKCRKSSCRLISKASLSSKVANFALNLWKNASQKKVVDYNVANNLPVDMRK